MISSKLKNNEHCTIETDELMVHTDITGPNLMLNFSEVGGTGAWNDPPQWTLLHYKAENHVLARLAIIAISPQIKVCTV